MEDHTSPTPSLLLLPFLDKTLGPDLEENIDVVVDSILLVVGFLVVQSSLDLDYAQQIFLLLKVLGGLLDDLPLVERSGLVDLLLHELSSLATGDLEDLRIDLA